MTTTPQETLKETPDPTYMIDPERIEAHGRASAVMVGGRRCESCKAAPDQKSKTAKPLTAKNHMQTIRKHCGRQPNYVGPEMPVMESSFRLLLASPGQPMPLSVLHQKLSDLWANSPLPRYISREALERVLSHDTYYGVVQVDSGEEEEKTE